MSLVGEKVTSIEVLAKGICNDIGTISVKESKGMMHMVVQVGDNIVVLRISGELKA